MLVPSVVPELSTFAGGDVEDAVRRSAHRLEAKSLRRAPVASELHDVGLVERKVAEHRHALAAVLRDDVVDDADHRSAGGGIGGARVGVVRRARIGECAVGVDRRAVDRRCVGIGRTRGAVTDDVRATAGTPGSPVVDDRCVGRSGIEVGARSYIAPIVH
jgi:hypothetical protein